MKLYGVDIPSNVHSMHHSCYDKSSEVFHIPNLITSLDNRIFLGIIGWDSSHLTSIVIPTSITTIPKYSFYQCQLLTNVSLPSTLTLIKKKAFWNCTSLQTINIPATVNKIEEFAFEKCCSLKSVILPISLPTYGTGCFRECYQLKVIINVPDHCF